MAQSLLQRREKWQNWYHTERNLINEHDVSDSDATEEEGGGGRAGGSSPESTRELRRQRPTQAPLSPRTLSPGVKKPKQAEPLATSPNKKRRENQGVISSEAKRPRHDQPEEARATKRKRELVTPTTHPKRHRKATGVLSGQLDIRNLFARIPPEGDSAANNHPT
jgi:hypothetical protein